MIGAWWNSLQRQLDAMEDNPDAVLCYGDYITISAYGIEKGPRRETPKYSQRHFRRAFAQGGAFWLLRRNVSDQIGYYDEQFSVAADMEFSFRIAAKGLSMTRCEGLVGYFTDAAQGLSTSQAAHISTIERTSVQLRYGVFDKIRREYLSKAQEFHLDEVKNNGRWIELSKFLPEHKAFLKGQKPLWIIGAVRNVGRALLKSLGLLSFIYWLQKKLIGTEI